MNEIYPTSQALASCTSIHTQMAYQKPPFAIGVAQNVQIHQNLGLISFMITILPHIYYVYESVKIGCQILAFVSLIHCHVKGTMQNFHFKIIFTQIFGMGY
jgi:hypothetical protein